MGLGETEVALALERFERAHQHGLAALLPARFKEGVERMQGERAHASVLRQVRIILGIAVERRERAGERSSQPPGLC
jgi:hypothetical protein